MTDHRDWKYGKLLPGFGVAPDGLMESDTRQSARKMTRR